MNMEKMYDWLFSEPVTRVVIVASLACAVALVIEVGFGIFKLYGGFHE
ncbi:MAG: hypothetical protein ACYDBI_05950 [Thermoplasmataceae archaeon]